MESTLSKQAARQAARRAAAAAQARLMQERLERDKRCAALGVQVLTANANAIGSSSRPSTSPGRRCSADRP